MGCFFLNEKGNCNTIGDLFQNLIDESATITHDRRLWDFLRDFFSAAISRIFAFLGIDERCSSHRNALIHILSTPTLSQECET